MNIEEKSRSLLVKDPAPLRPFLKDYNINNFIKLPKKQKLLFYLFIHVEIRPDFNN